jgi:pimeloyl-ACP methyl ester carboxylesterase
VRFGVPWACGLAALLAVSRILAQESGPCPVVEGERDVARPDGSRLGVLVFAPRETAHDARCAGPRPLLVFAHGFFQEPWRYGSMLRALASRGYVVAAPRSETGIWPNAGRFATDLSLVGDALARLMPLAADGFYAVGHSMGGGAVLRWAARDRRVRAVVAVSTADRRGELAPLARMLGTRALLVAGDRDGIVPLADTRALAEAGAVRLVTIAGGSHCGVQGEPFPLFCDEGAIAPSSQQAETVRIIADFFADRSSSRA